MREDKFGFLNQKCSLKFHNVEVCPLDTYDKQMDAIEENLDFSKFYCPPIKTSTHLYNISPSHKLRIKSKKTIKQLRMSDAGFLIHLIGYLYGCRLQFHDLWFEKRLPMRSQHNVHFSKEDAEDFLGNTYKKWKEYPPLLRKMFINLLYMHSRNSSYRLEWERFIMEFVVFDGLWRIYAEKNNVNHKVAHIVRFTTMLKKYKMFVHKRRLNRMVRLRNHLLHQCLWDGKQPGSAGKQDAFYAYYWLSKINKRLIPALFEYKTSYIKSDWVSLGAYRFRM